MITLLTDVIVLSLLIATALGMVVMRNVFSAAMLLGIFSLLSALFFVSLDAVDVAFTEAAIGAGMSLILMLTALGLTDTGLQQRSRLQWGPLVLVSLTGLALIYGTLDLPLLGDVTAPVHQHVVPRYLDSYHEVGLLNLVTAVLASYRGFDTLGETFVVFTAGIAVMGLLNPDRDTRALIRESDRPMYHHTILVVISRLFIPLILLFALYVQFHGDFGPGGGFQAGVIFATGLILYAMLYGTRHAERVINPTTRNVIMSGGVWLYAFTGVTAMILGGEFLNYSVFMQDAVQGQHYGVFLVELGVGMTVAMVMLSMFYAFSEYLLDHTQDIIQDKSLSASGFSRPASEEHQ